MLDKKNRLKIAHVVASLNVGGAERFVIDLCQTQKKQGEHPLIISLGQPGEPLEAECDSVGVTFFSSKFLSVIKLFQVFFRLRNIDIGHIHSSHALKFLRSIVPFLNKKIIYTRHGAAPLKAEHWKKLHINVRPFIKAATFVSNEGVENFKNMHGWHDTLLNVIDNGVLINPIDSTRQASKKLKIGSVGRMIPLKNQLGLLQAIAIMPEEVKKCVEVHFFGDGECLNSLKIYNKENLPNTDVHFHGMVNDREFIYSSFDLLVVTSETEGLSMVIIEAMANKIPVIATNVGGNPKLVIPNKTGWLFEYADDEKLAEFIESIVVNKTILEPLGQAAFCYISENFSIESSAKKYEALYEG
jgi:glycosyltransferase involved in cell wall biosynthesis